MKLEAANRAIKGCSERMNAVYGSVVFDEWAIVSFSSGKGSVTSYSGPRKNSFHKNFAADLDALRPELLNTKQEIGDFEFARNATGTHFDAFMTLGSEIYLICNSTVASIQTITKDSRWLGAQVAFAELSEKFRADPLID